MVVHLGGPFPLDDPRPGVTFPVDRVEPAREPLSTASASSIAAARIGGPILVADLGADRLIEARDVARAGRPEDSHAFADAVHLAFSQHRPLILSPDVVWLTIAQGIATHVTLHAEQLRSKLVDFDGKRELTVKRGELQRGDWAEIVGDFASLVAANSKIDALPPMVASFSTTTPASRVASQICMLDAFSRYYDYVLMCICGFPQITLLGTVADWMDIQARVARLRDIGLGWWAEHLQPICAQFIAAAAGDIDRRHWRKLYKIKKIYGSPEISGWFAKLFPYVLDQHHVPRLRNPMLTGERRHLYAAQLPKGLSRADVRMQGAAGANRLVLVAGCLGVRQHGRTLALEPSIGWAVTEADAITRLIQTITEDLEHEHVRRRTAIDWRAYETTAEFMAFFDEFEQVRLFAHDPTKTITLKGPDVRIGHGPDGREIVFFRDMETDAWQVCVIEATTTPAQARQAIAASFLEFLTRCLAEGPYWLQSSSTS
jgi:hypothetical protein